MELSSNENIKLSRKINFAGERKIEGEREMKSGKVTPPSNEDDDQDVNIKPATTYTYIKSQGR